MQTDTRLEGVVHIVLISVLGTEFDFMAVYDKIDVVVVWVDEKDFILVDWHWFGFCIAVEID